MRPRRLDFRGRRLCGSTTSPGSTGSGRVTDGDACHVRRPAADERRPPVVAGPSERPARPVRPWNGPPAGDGGSLSFLTVYETQTWVAAAVNKLNRGIMDLPLRLYREVTDDGEVEPVYRHPVMDAILKPWERGSASH
jgi:hypothetical protein